MSVAARRESFPAYYRRDVAKLARMAGRLTGSPTDGEDLAQDVLEQMSRNWQRLVALDSVDAYARRAVSNRSRTLFRRRQAEAEALARLAPHTMILDPGVDPPTDWLWAIVRALPGRHHPAVIALHVGEDRSLAEVAAILEISAASARQAKRRALQRLRLALSVHG